MENKEYEQAPKKDSKSLHLVIGIVIGAVIATVIILVVLFATGIIGEKGSEETATTTVATKSLEMSDAEKNTKPSDEKTPSASNGKYKEFKIENATVNHIDKNDNSKSYTTTENIIIQIPYMKEFEELGLDLDKLEIDTEDSIFIKDGKIAEAYIYASDGTQQIPLIAIICDGNEILYDNIVMMYFDCGFTDPDTGLEKGFDGRYLGTDELVWAIVRTDGKNEIGYGLTNSGYSFKDGTYYDNNGNIVTEKAYQEELNRIDEEVFATLASQGFNF